MIRLEAISYFSQMTSLIGHYSTYEVTFPKFYHGYLIDSKLKTVGKRITINVNGSRFAIGKIESKFDLNAYQRQEVTFGELMAEAVPLDDDAIIPSSDLRLSLITGDDLLIYFPRCEPEPDEETTDSAPSLKVKNSHGHIRTCQNEISEGDRAILDTVALISSGEVTDLLTRCQVKLSKKKLPELCFDMNAPHLVVAAVRVLNNNYSGDSGEDVFVQEIHSQNKRPAFSRSFGTSEEWIENRQQRPAHSEFTPTEEEVTVLSSYNAFIKQL